jgi:arsenate reductase (thioredoxin)
VTTAETYPPVPEAAPAAAPKIRVLFVCSGNSARSQMAEAILRKDAGERFEVASGGTNPRPIDPYTVRVLAEAGIDSTDATSKSVTKFLGRRFDYVITLCDRARVECPVFPGGAQTLHWGLDDPAEAEGTDAQRLQAFRHALTEVSGRIRAFIPLATLAASR